MAEKLRRRLRARLLAGIAGIVPPALAHGALALLSPLARFTRFERTARENLERALGGETTTRERARIAGEVRLHAARIFAEWLRLSRGGDQGWVDEAVEVDPSIEILRAQLERGRGAIVVTAHLGNWELLCARLRRMGIDGAVVGLSRPRDSSSLWLSDMRRAYGVTTLSPAANPREILRILARGGVVGVLADMEVRRVDFEFLPFLGIPALTMTAPAALARAAGLPLVPARCVRIGGRWRLSVEEPLRLDPGLPRREATRELMTRLNAVFGRWIREHPGQWAWHQPRWRTRPGEIEPAPLASREFART